MRVLLPLVFVSFTYSKESYFIGQNFNLKLTAERSGPPKGALFAPIPVVSLPFSNNKFSSRPFKGRPPPPPPPPPKTSPPKTTQRPRPTSTTTSSPIAPPPPPVPVPVNQEVPQVSEGSPGVPNLPPNVTVVTPATEIRPDLETVATSPPPPPTTTPRTKDSAPALTQKSWQNEDGSYYFDFQAANSIKRAEQGFFKHKDQINPIHVKSGMYSFTSPEGVPFRVDYVADERGYRSFIRFT